MPRCVCVPIYIRWQPPWRLCAKYSLLSPSCQIRVECVAFYVADTCLIFWLLLDATKSHLVYGCRVSSAIASSFFIVDSWSLLLPVFRVLGLRVRWWQIFDNCLTIFCQLLTTFDNFLTTFWHHFNIIFDLFFDNFMSNFDFLHAFFKNESGLIQLNLL
jgi:hypothetical protein